LLGLEGIEPPHVGKADCLDVPEDSRLGQRGRVVQQHLAVNGFHGKCQTSLMIDKNKRALIRC